MWNLAPYFFILEEVGKFSSEVFSSSIRLEAFDSLFNLFLHENLELSKVNEHFTLWLHWVDRNVLRVGIDKGHKVSTSFGGNYLNGTPHIQVDESLWLGVRSTCSKMWVKFIKDKIIKSKKDTWWKCASSKRSYEDPMPCSQYSLIEIRIQNYTRLIRY